MRPLRNVFACLVHERPECVMDLLRNLRRLDPASAILVYNGGDDPGLLEGIALASMDAAVVPGALMPHVSITDPAEQIYLVAFLRTLKTPPR